MQTVLTQKAESPIERWLGFFVGGNPNVAKVGGLQSQGVKGGLRLSSAEVKL